MISKGMDGREYLLTRSPVCQAGPEETDIVCVGQQRSAGRTTVQVHLLFDRHAKILHDMEPVCDLCRLRCALTGSLSIEAAAIPADHLNFRMVL